MKKNKLKPIEYLLYGCGVIYYIVGILFLLWLSYVIISAIPDIIHHIKVWR